MNTLREFAVFAVAFVGLVAFIWFKICRDLPDDVASVFELAKSKKEAE